jgi:hypothetical protein
LSRLSGSHGWQLDEAQQPARGELAQELRQKVSACQGPISTPSTSRRPSLPPTAMITATEAMRAHLMSPAFSKSSFQIVMARWEGCLPLLTLSGMVIGEARQIQVFEQHRRMMSASVGLGSGGDGYCHAFDF